MAEKVREVLFNGPRAFPVGALSVFESWHHTRVKSVGHCQEMASMLMTQTSIAYLFFLYNNVMLTNTQISIITLLTR